MLDDNIVANFQHHLIDTTFNCNDKAPDSLPTTEIERGDGYIWGLLDSRELNLIQDPISKKCGEFIQTQEFKALKCLDRLRSRCTRS